MPADVAGSHSASAVAPALSRPQCSPTRLYLVVLLWLAGQAEGQREGVFVPIGEPIHKVGAPRIEEPQELNHIGMPLPAVTPHVLQ